MKPLEALSFIELLRLIDDHGTFQLADGRIAMKRGEKYILRGPEGEISFKHFGDLERYIAWHGATFHHVIVDAEEARQLRIARRLQQQEED